MSVSSCSDAGYLFEDQSAQGSGTDCISSTAKSQLNTKSCSAARSSVSNGEGLRSGQACLYFIQIITDCWYGYICCRKRKLRRKTVSAWEMCAVNSENILCFWYIIFSVYVWKEMSVFKLDETYSGNMHQNSKSHHRRPSLPHSSPPFPQIQCAVGTQTQTQSASNDCFIDEARVYSLTQACNNYRPNQLERGWEKTLNKPKESHRETIWAVFSTK